MPPPPTLAQTIARACPRRSESNPHHCSLRYAGAGGQCISRLYIFNITDAAAAQLPAAMRGTENHVISLARVRRRRGDIS
eukprot:3693328-Pyramimonas_sp.AAC.1